ncbi:fibroin light chain-like [Plodia interpunctella]|uniref:fibroin light chain-like n=1 Tax=Plodia interpunctella TaxID=58824 RepID=UPI00236805EC|nr:fibroin light chain-like [Plodia interpunctella]
MLPIVLVLFVAAGSFAAPSVSIIQAGINQIPRLPDDGRLVNSQVIDSAFESYDGGDTNIYILTIQEILKDLASRSDADSQSLAVGSAIATLGELAPGTPGDACQNAALINAVAGGVGSSALGSWANGISNAIDNIVLLVNNPNAARNAVGARGNCAGGGRSYQFEAAWNAAFETSNPYNIGLINEQYCAAKRLYGALNNRSNNVGAAVSAAATAPARAALQQALPQLANFLRVVGNGGNPAGAASAAKSAIRSAAANVQATGLY